MEGYFTLDVPKLQKERSGGNEKQAFPHQLEAFSALSKTLTIPISGYKGTLLVLPTGGGKTFTSINWICRHVLSANIKVLWLAQTAYLIDQAAQAFEDEIHNATGRSQINMRVVSSSSHHANAGTIATTDDILICTTQTAISAFKATPLDYKGDPTTTPFKRFIESCADCQLFVVVDEAHHTPAYGCRTLIWGTRNEADDPETEESFRTVVKNLYVLGLTATPTHMDKNISGWLNIIFDKGICYEAKKEPLQLLNILAVPEYIQRKTPMEFEVDDTLFNRLVHKHKDLPEYIIDELAVNQGRNNFIVSDYLNNKEEYGKTIIFADRWHQCEYIIKKLQENNVRAEAVYSMVSKNSGSYEYGAGRSDNNKHNKEVIDDFRSGKYDVVVNVRMLTEGVDVPDVKTVMITRQTTSNILMTQMIGRALRGKKANGGEDKDFANVVFFHDTWKRLLPNVWARGDAEIGKPEPVPRPPLEWVSIHLVKLAAGDIEFFPGEDVPYLTFIPIGFFGCEYTVAVNENEEMATFTENVIAYKFNKGAYDNMISTLDKMNLTKYADEKLTDDKFEELTDKLSCGFNLDKDNFDGALTDNIIKIIRHMAQNGHKPDYLEFKDRVYYDMDEIAEKLMDTPPRQANDILMTMYSDFTRQWQYLYKTFDNFMKAFHASLRKKFTRDTADDTTKNLMVPTEVVLTNEVKEQIKIRDNYTCLCCGKIQSKGVPLDVDHIVPVAMGGKNDITNLQTLCKRCNAVKGINTISYRIKLTSRSIPKSAMIFHDAVGSDNPRNAIARIVNEFYHCAAMLDLNYHERKNGKYYHTWGIVLYSGNNPEWLLPHLDKILDYVKNKLGYTYVRKITIRDF